MVSYINRHAPRSEPAEPIEWLGGGPGMFHFAAAGAHAPGAGFESSADGGATSTHHDPSASPSQRDVESAPAS